MASVENQNSATDRRYHFGRWALYALALAILAIVVAVVAWIVSLGFIFSCPQFGTSTQNQCFSDTGNTITAVALYAFYAAVAGVLGAAVLGVIAVIAGLVRSFGAEKV